jgi:hypothetical protein
LAKYIQLKNPDIKDFLEQLELAEVPEVGLELELSDMPPSV